MSESTDIDRLQLERDITSARTRREMYLAAIVVGVGLALVVALAILTVVGRGQDVEAARREAEEAKLQSEENGRKLDNALLELEAAQADDIESTICADRFINAQRATNLEAFAAQAELVAALIPTDPPMPEADRRRLLLELRDKQRSAVAAYRDVIELSRNWSNEGRPLPCPLTV
jgi:hypothetical protein